MPSGDTVGSSIDVTTYRVRMARLQGLRRGPPGPPSGSNGRRAQQSRGPALASLKASVGRTD
eukprot:14736094-Alexandrium_andersonii.AAC.1